MRIWDLGLLPDEDAFRNKRRNEDDVDPRVVTEILAKPQEFALSRIEGSRLEGDGSLYTLKNRPLRGRQLRVGEPIYLFPERGNPISAYVVSLEPGKGSYKGERTTTIVAVIASQEAVA